MGQVSSTLPLITDMSRPPFLECLCAQTSPGLSVVSSTWFRQHPHLPWHSFALTRPEAMIRAPASLLGWRCAHPAASLRSEEMLLWIESNLTHDSVTGSAFSPLTPSSRYHTRVFHCLLYMCFSSIHLTNSSSYLDTNSVKEPCLAGLPRLGGASPL